MPSHTTRIGISATSSYSPIPTTYISALTQSTREALLVGWSDFHNLQMAVPSPRNLAPGIPVDLLEAGALAAAARAATIEPGEILALVSEACEIARDPGKFALDKDLSDR